MENNMTAEFRIVAVVQARLGSTRFPRKVLAPLGLRPALSLLFERLRRSKRVTDFKLAIPEGEANRDLEAWATSMNIDVISGSELDVLARFHRAAATATPDYVVRITGDCPFIDPDVIDAAVEKCISEGAGYVVTDETYPDGLDVEVCEFALLDRAMREATDQFDREHVMPFVRKLAGERVGVLRWDLDLNRVRLTLDEPSDLEVLNLVYRRIGHDRFTAHDLANLFTKEPHLFSGNAHLERNEGASMTNGEKLWKRAKKVIPGGNMLLSKRSEMHLQKGWPSYFSRAKGCKVWDLDGNEYIDAGLFGIGTNILGFGHPVVDQAVRTTVDSGNMSTLNCPEEVYLAERLVEMHPWSGMVRLTRSGGEACAVAVRIARAYSGKSAVAFCGYHGWHDWYLSANLSEDSNLDGHLLPGLMPAGVPRGLAGTARPFAYNDREALVNILDKGDVGVIFMEVRRGSEPDAGFLQAVRSLATQHGAILIFDECTSGFRKTFGGIHLDYGVDPDIATFGKTLGNGYAINAVLGRTEVMQAAQDTFISSTFWTERIGPSAALATLEVMKAEDATNRIHQTGLQVQETWRMLGERNGLSVIPAGIPSIATYSIEGFDPIVAKTFVTQEMLKRGFIAGNALYSSLAHTEEVLNRYAENLDHVFADIAKSDSTSGLERRLDSGPAQSGFQRLA